MSLPACESRLKTKRKRPLIKNALAPHQGVFIEFRGNVYFFARERAILP